MKKGVLTFSSTQTMCLINHFSQNDLPVPTKFCRGPKQNTAKRNVIYCIRQAVIILAFSLPSAAPAFFDHSPFMCYTVHKRPSQQLAILALDPEISANASAL